MWQPTSPRPRTGSSGAERLVPFVEALVPEVDLAAGTLTLADVAGLLEDIEDEETR